MGNLQSEEPVIDNRERDRVRKTQADLKTRLDKLVKDRAALTESFDEEYAEIKISISDIKTQLKELKQQQTVAVTKLKQEDLDISRCLAELEVKPLRRSITDSRSITKYCKNPHISI